MDRALVVAGVLALVAVLAVALRQRRGGAPRRVDPGELGLNGHGGVGVVAFSSPYCLSCQRWEEALGERGVDHLTIDLAERPELARRYSVSQTPLVLVVRLPTGDAVAAFDDEPGDAELEHVRRLVEAG